MAEYIERGAVMQKFADHVKRSNNSDFAQTPTWNQAVQIVEDIPAADVAPVRHGRWIDRGSCEFECPFCGKIIFADDERERNYCCSCGAKMDMDVYEWLESQVKGGEQ